jgi:anti-anti-sigma factor
MTPGRSPIERPFRLRREDRADVAVLVVEGDVDVATAPELRAALEWIPGDRKLVVDLSETRFMDSTGLHALLAADNALKRDMRIACTPAGPVARLFETALAGRDLRIYDSRADALADF